MKFVIYGAGYRGKRLIEYILQERVIAFIDSDINKINTEICGIPVISIDDYQQNYAQYFIISSPTYTDEIGNLLIEREIYHFSDLHELPSEFSGYGKGNFDECYKDFCVGDTLCDIYGINAFSMLLYEKLEHEGKNVVLIPDTKADCEKVKFLQKNYPQIRIMGNLREKTSVLLAKRVWEEKECEWAKEHKVIDAFLYTSELKYYFNKDIFRMKDIYKDKKRCFIVATGPSLRKEDLELLKEKNEFCMGMNTIYAMKDEWVPDMYVCVDSGLIGKAKTEIDAYPCKCKVIGDSNVSFWKEGQTNTVKIHVTAADNYGVMPKFSEDLAQGAFAGNTVTYVCMQIAVYLGFKEIYLLGVDCNYIKGSQNNHFVKSEQADNKIHNTDGMILAYHAAKEYADNHGIKILNATRGGKLEVFERVDFDKLFIE